MFGLMGVWNIVGRVILFLVVFFLFLYILISGLVVYLKNNIYIYSYVINIMYICKYVFIEN